MKVLEEGALIPYALINLTHFSGSVFLYIFNLKIFYFSYMFVCWVILLHKSLKCKTVDLTNNTGNLKYHKISQV